jgi:hypothetical protein
MPKIELVKAELAFHGIRVMDDGLCLSYMEGQDQPVQSSVRDKIHHIKYEMEADKEGLRVFWGKMLKALYAPSNTLVGGTPTTEKMFVAALKHMLRFSKKYNFFKKDTKIIQAALRKDVKRFNETTMSKVIDYKICIDWLDHLVHQGKYCADMLAFFEKHRHMMADAAKHNVPVVADLQMMPSGVFDMEGDEHDPLKERRWLWDDEDATNESSREGEFNTDVGPKSGMWHVEFDKTQGLDSLYDLGDENDPYKGKIKPTSYRGPV